MGFERKYTKPLSDGIQTVCSFVTLFFLVGDKSVIWQLRHRFIRVIVTEKKRLLIILTMSFSGTKTTAIFMKLYVYLEKYKYYYLVMDPIVDR